jgi:signal transduction histidine kinase/DNA-binding NarL/FixJ family response regulator
MSCYFSKFNRAKTKILQKHILHTLIGLLTFIVTSTIDGQPIAQSQPFTITESRITTENGLSHEQLNDMCKDDRGIIWIATRYGLNRYDGRSFKIFYKKDGLLLNDINQVYADGELLWCIYSLNNTFAISLFHTILEKEISLKEHLKEDLPFEESDIESLFIEEGRLYFQLDESHNHTFYTYHPQEGIRELPIIQNGEKWIGQTSPNHFWLYRQVVNGFIVKEVNSTGQTLQKIHLDHLEAKKASFHLIERHQDSLPLLLYQKKGIDKLFFLYQNDTLNHLKVLSKENKRALAYDLVYHATYIPQYDAYWSNGINYTGLVNLKGDILYQWRNKFGRSHILLKDKNSIWLHLNSSLYQIDIERNLFKTELKGYSSRGITVVGDRTYVAVHSNLLSFSTNQQKNIQDIESLGINTFNVLSNSRGILWINSGLNMIQQENKELITYPEVFKNGEIWAWYEDKKGQIWFDDEDGLYTFDPTTQKKKPIPLNGHEELKRGLVYHFYKKATGQFLLCANTGLYELDVEKGITNRYWSGGTGAFYLPTDDFQHLYFDKKDNSYWLASGGEGLIHWKPKQNQHTIYSFNNIKTNVVHAVYPSANFEKDGFLWLSSDYGIIQFHTEGHTFRTYLPKNGTSSHEFNRASHFQDKEGTIYFGSIDGVTVFQPNDFNEGYNSQEETNIIIVEFHQFLNKTGKIENLTADFHQKQSIHLEPRDRFFNLKLGLDNYAQTKEAIFYYQIEGDETWQTSTNQNIPISGLPYGKKMLYVKAQLPNGRFSEMLEIPVRLAKPFHMTAWFWGFILFLGTGLTYLGIWWRTIRLQEQKEHLATEVTKQTAKIRADKEIIETQAEELRELDQTKTRFFANVSHELRTPITLIQGPIQSVLGRQRLENRDFTLLSTAEQSSKKLLNLVNEILDLTKLDSDKIQLEETKVVFYTYLRRIVSNFQSIADRKAIEIIFEYQAPKALQLKIDENKFEKIINNLLSNALKFTQKDGQILVTVTDEAQNIMLLVKDTGRGIPPKELPNIFNRFYQSSTNTKSEGGLGIGLALSIELAKLMRGELWAESSIEKENHGSTFYLKFPKREIISMLSTKDKRALEENNSQEIKVNQELTVPIINQSDNEQPKTTILLVEDNMDLGDYIKFLLEPYYEVVTRENGREALDYCLLPTANCELIISDIMMPVMDGYELAEELKAHPKWRNTPLIMLTALVETKDKLKALRIGVDDYIVKPFKEEELLVRIANLLANYKERKDYVVTHEADISSDQDEKTVLQPSMTATEMEWLEQVEGLVLTHVTSSLFGVDYFAELNEMNRRTFYRKIKSLTGLSPNQYFRVIRLQLAKKLLEEESCRSVKEVATKVGFSKSGYFSSLYKKEFGKSPAEFFM